jgi:hypothetical protein
MNRKIAFILTPIILYSCQNSKESSNDFEIMNDQKIELFDDLRLPEQKFKINPSDPTEIVCAQGTRIYFPADCFKFPEESKKNNAIVIKVKEYYKASDIVLGNLTTQTNEGNILETAGMINIEAFYGEEKVELKEEALITIYFNLRDSIKNPEMELYNGKFVSKADPIKWDLQSDSIAQTNFGSESYYQLDSILSPSEIGKQNEDYKKSLEYYIFKSSNLGWLNCDRLISNQEDGYVLTVKIDPTIKPVIRVVYKEYNSICAGYLNDDQTAVTFSPIIPNQTVTIFGFSKIGNQVFCGLSDVVLDKDLQINFELKKVSLEELKEEARRLEWPE